MHSKFCSDRWRRTIAWDIHEPQKHPDLCIKSLFRLYWTINLYLFSILGSLIEWKPSLNGFHTWAEPWAASSYVVHFLLVYRQNGKLSDIQNTSRAASRDLRSLNEKNSRRYPALHQVFFSIWLLFNLRCYNFHLKSDLIINFSLRWWPKFHYHTK